MVKLVAEKMTVSKINTVIPCDIQKVWGIVTSVENYTWRSDLSKLEVLDETRFVEYTKNDYPTFFTVTFSEQYMRWEFDMENSNMRGHWVGLFTGREQETEIEFTEYVTVKKFYLKPFVKSYLKKQQALFVSDLEKEVFRQKGV